MQTVSQLLGGQAEPHHIDHNGKRYEIRPLTQKVKTQIERRLAAEVRAVLIGPPGETPPEVVAIALRQHARDVVNGVFSFYGPACVEWLSSLDGVRHLGSVLIGCSEDELYELLAEHGEEVAHLIEVAIRESLSPAMLRMLDKAEAAAEPPIGNQGGVEQADPNV